MTFSLSEKVIKKIPSVSSVPSVVKKFPDGTIPASPVQSFYGSLITDY
jgi:hypothetical protein